MRFTIEMVVQKQALSFVPARSIRTEAFSEHERHPLGVSTFFRIYLSPEHILKTLRFLSLKRGADSRRSRLDILDVFSQFSTLFPFCRRNLMIFRCFRRFS